MTPPTPTPPPGEPEPHLRMPPRYARRILLFMVPVLLTPVLLAVCLFPLLREEAFDSIDELRPENISTFRVQIQNRKEIDGGEPIDLFYVAESDYESLLLPLFEVPEAKAYAGARGPWLGEYRVVTKEGRTGRVRLYWTTPTRGAEPVLRFRIGPKEFEGGAALTVVNAAKIAESRGRKSRGWTLW